MAKKKPLWKCPRCGHRFVTANMWHSCGHVALAAHFENKPPHLRALFDAWLKYVEQFGPVTVIPQKTRICFQVRVRFAGAVVRSTYLRCSFWLKRKVTHALIEKVEQYAARDFVYHFRLDNTAALKTPGLRALVREAYRVGCQGIA
jgi:hypothetical protein